MTMCTDKILDKLFLGGVLGSFEATLVREKGITHILTIMDRPLPAELVKGFVYKYVYALDMYDNDLLQELEECLSFIEEGIRSGGVLVHCQAGTSRSASLVIAYIMRTLNMNRLEALEFVKRHRPIVSPNEGFLRQLDLFELMGCRVVETHEEFRRYMLSKMAVRSKSGFDQTALPASIYQPELPLSSGSETIYKCKKCRRTLFHSGVLMVHEKGQGESAFDWRSKLPASQCQEKTDNDEDVVGNAVGEKCDVSLFVEPVEWMRGQIETVEGKLGCPKCNSKLGSFVWYGERCPCGAWVAPAFHIQKSKVDAVQLHNTNPLSQHIAVPFCSSSQPQFHASQQIARTRASGSQPELHARSSADQQITSPICASFHTPLKGD